MSKNDRNYSSSGYRRIVNAVDVLWLLIHVGIEIYLYWGCANLKALSKLVLQVADVSSQFIYSLTIHDPYIVPVTEF